MRYFIIILAGICFLFVLSCAIDVPEKGYEYLAPPVIVSCERQGDNIVVEFTGYNDEYYFDGYNVYVSDSSLNRESVAKYRPVQIEGYPSSEPSLPMSPDDYDPRLVRRVTIYQYYWISGGEYIPYPLSSDTTYYIFICAHHRLGYVFPEGVSNQVSSPGVE